MLELLTIKYHIELILREEWRKFGAVAIVGVRRLDFDGLTLILEAAGSHANRWGGRSNLLIARSRHLST